MEPRPQPLGWIATLLVIIFSGIALYCLFPDWYAEGLSALLGLFR